MAYTHSKNVVWLTASGGDNQVTATDVDTLRFVCPWPPHKVRRFGVMLTASGSTATAAVFTMYTATSPTASSLTTIGTINGNGSGDSGVVFLSTGLNNDLNPGNIFYADITTTGGAGASVRAFAYVEPTWETATNSTNVFVTT